VPVLQALAKQLAATPSIAQLLGTRPAQNPADTGIFISLAVKQAQRPFLVMHLLAAPPAAESLDGITALVDGEIQFDSYGDDPVIARKLSQTLKALLGGSSFALGDGAVVQFTAVTMDADEPYELGGGGYIYRSLLRLQTFYTEAGS
jgi:hypothetical protein